jgi:hypothetical protein
MDSAIILLFAIVLVIGVTLFAFVTLGKRGGRVLNVEKYRVRWLEVEQSLVKDNQASYHMAVLNADKLVDQALRDKGFTGQTMGDRLKVAKGQFTRLDALWDAHKLRNRIAHEPDIRVSYDQSRRALAGFKRALKDLGAI